MCAKLQANQKAPQIPKFQFAKWKQACIFADAVLALAFWTQPELVTSVRLSYYKSIITIFIKDIFLK
jgi:hypothetical protein